MIKYLTIYTTAELICLIAAVVCLYNAKALHWRLLIPFMLITCLVEIGALPLKAVYRANPIPSNSSAWMYNLLLLLQMGAFTVMFYNFIGKYLVGKFLIVTGITILLLLYIYEIYTNAFGIFNYNSRTYSVMSVLFVIYSLSYYYALLKNEEYAELKFLPDFWWATGTLFFFFGTTALNMFRSKLVIQPLKNTLYLGYLDTTLIVILYGCWTYAFICKRWITSNKK